MRSEYLRQEVTRPRMSASRDARVSVERPHPSPRVSSVQFLLTLARVIEGSRSRDDTLGVEIRFHLRQYQQGLPTHQPPSNLPQISLTYRPASYILYSKLLPNGKVAMASLHVNHKVSDNPLLLTKAFPQA